MEAKKIIITGGATRIGAAIAKSIASFDTKITIHYNTSKNDAGKIKSELENLGSEVFLVKANLENQKQTESLFKQAYQKMKGVDCLINNASVFENDNLLNFSEKSFAKHLKGQTPKQFITRPEFKDFVDGMGFYKWSTDQMLLNWFVKKENVKCKNMNWKWNALYTAVDKNRMNESHFIHFFLRDKLPAKGENIEELLKKLI